MTAVPSDATPQDSALAAEAYASLGWRIVPIAPGKKYPQGLGRWQDAATDNLDEIRNWYTGLYQGHGVGIATGAGSGIWVLDIDIADEKTGADSLRGLVAEHGDLPPTPTAVTGTGGMHIYYAWDPTRPVTNGSATNLPPGLDIRGEGGQVLAAPTTHPNGRRYRWIRDPWTTPLAEAPDWLYQHFTPEPAPELPIEAAALPTTAGAAASTDDSIAEWARNTYQFDTLLQADGWTLHSTRGDDTYWTRPGKQRRDGHSAVLHGPDGPLVVFTTEIPTDLVTAGTATADGSGISVSLFGYLAGTRHHGDRSACARALRQQRNHLEGRGPIEPIDAAALIGQQPSPAAPGVMPALPQLPAGPSGFTELGDWWDNPEPSLTADALLRTDGTGLLYLTQLNWIHGDSGSGKTWVLLHQMRQLIDAGHHVAWVHYEDPNPAAIIGRLKLLGADRDTVIERFHYWDPQGEPIATGPLLAACKDAGVVHVGLDSVGEALGAAGLNEDSDAEVGPWIATGPRALVNHGIGATCLDHGTKDTKTAPLHPSGSKRKRAAVTGAGLLIRAHIPPTRTSDGRMEIICGKDRHGNHPQGQAIAHAHLRHNLTTGAIDFTITAPGGQVEEDDGLAKRIREVVRLVTDTPGITRYGILPLMATASRERKNIAIDAAINQGEIRVELGPRKAQKLYIDD